MRSGNALVEQPSRRKHRRWRRKRIKTKFKLTLGDALLHFERADETPRASDEIARHKARAAALFGVRPRRSKRLWRRTRVAAPSLRNITPQEGGLPRANQGRIVGAIGVSGAIGSGLHFVPSRQRRARL